MTYNEFIDKCKARYIDENTYTEKHHIIPKCMGGTNDESNLITLTAQEHYIAHKLLAQENPDNNKLQYAFWQMSHCKKECRDYIVDENDFAKAKQIHSILCGNQFRGVPKSEEQKKKMSDSQKGREFTEEHKKHISEGQKGKIIKPETRIKISEKRKWHETSDETRKKIAEALSVKIICITTNIIYNGANEAERLTGINHSDIIRVCRGKRKHAGKLSDGTKLSWAYYNEKEGD